MKVTIKGIVNENIDPEEKYINKLSSILTLPYLYNLKLTSTPESLWNRILSKIYNQEVTLIDNSIYDSNNNRIYRENSDGFWYKREYDLNGNRIYYEDSNGNWYKYEYNSNGNLIYREDSDGFWEKQEYNSNGNVIYREDSDGNWYKYEYNSNGNVIYREDSDGEIIDRRSSNSINENIDTEEKYINKMSSILTPPYLYNLRSISTPESLWNRILSNIFNQEVGVSRYRIHDSNNNQIYREDSDGYWIKKEYNSNGNVIYLEDSDGEIIDNRYMNTINENIDPEEKYINKMSSIIKRPYFYNLIHTDTPKYLWSRILSNKLKEGIHFNGEGYKYGYEYTLNVKSNKDGHIIYDEISHRLVNNLPFWSQTKDIRPQNSDMSYVCYVNSRGNKEVSVYSTSKGEFLEPLIEEKYYSNQPQHGLPFEDLPEEIKNDEIFNLNY